MDMNNPTMDENHFDRLSDDLLRCIFNKVLDVKTLTQCLSVSKRFASLVPQTNTVSLSIPHRHCPNPSPTSSSSSSPSFFKTLINKFITKPLQFLHRIIDRNSAPSSDSEDESYYSPAEVLKSFNEIQSLHLQLPCHGEDLGFDDFDSVLKWKAEFGSQLQSCVILGATSFQNKTVSLDDNRINGKELQEEQGEEEEQQQEQGNENSTSELLFTNDELKLRVVWTISSLIAASARHYLLKQIIKDRPMLRNVVITDAHKQGRLCMKEEQIVEMRRGCCSMNSTVTVDQSSSSLELERSRVPALKVKLWYVPVLELPATGWQMKGATLVVIRAVDEMMKEGCDGDQLLEDAFDGEEEKEALGEAVREIMKKKKKRAYTMEMDSF